MCLLINCEEVCGKERQIWLNLSKDNHHFLTSCMDNCHVDFIKNF